MRGKKLIESGVREKPPIKNDPGNLLHELSVPQAELEKQVQDLTRVRGELESALAKYLELYEHAPVGYFTHSAGEKILEANLTAARLLGIARSSAKRTRVRVGEQNQQRLVSVVEDSNDAVTVLDLKGNILAWNRRAEEIYGFSTAEALKMTIFHLVPSRLKKETLKMLNDIKSGVFVPSFETKRVGKGGSIVDIRLTVTRLMQDERIVGVATTERDVTEYNRWLASIKELPHRIIMAQEKERGRISQEIHGDFSQSLLALKMFVSMSSADLDEKDTRTKHAMEQIQIKLTRIIDKARNLSHKLAPPSLKYIGLIEAIKNLVESAQFDKNLKVHFLHSNMDQVSFEKKNIIFYRIVQEGLLNIIKHAKATKASLKVLFQDSTVFLEITDNGTGFLPEKPRHSKGLGLDLLREQVELVRGTLKIESKIGKGTTIRVTVPIQGKKK